MSTSILDQVISSQKMSAISDFDPEGLAAKLFKVLSEREEDIIIRRHGLNGKEKITLEEIGNHYSVTRERIRQVENTSLNRIRQEFKVTLLKDIEYLVRNILEDNGDLMAEERLVQNLVADKASDANLALVRFILNQLLSDQLSLVRESDTLYKSWALPSMSWDIYDKAIDAAIKILEEHKEPVRLESLIERARERIKLHPERTHNYDSILLNYLDVTKQIEENKFNEWGLSHWSSIRPRRMNDKIYLVMKKEGTPMHFVDIAKKINEAGFDKRIAYPATIHNELILDDKYVLVGRGIYALREWGYKPGVVLDVIKEILASSKRPMTKDEIIAEVMKNRMVKKSTVILALMNKKHFSKDSQGRYSPAL